MQPSIYSIRFSKVGKLYHFDAGHIADLKVGEYVVVETARGRQLGEVIQTVENPPAPPEGTWKSVERKATPGDLLLRQTWVQKQTEAMINCRARSAELQIPGVKIVSAEYSYDGSRLTFMFSTETEDKVDLKSLRKDMQKLYPQSQVDMRQIGPRDVAKILGGMGACGLETRCCSSFLTEFSPVSIKMAKEQGLSLNPEEITGMCGRLRCCLVYEYENYVAARKVLPKRGKLVATPRGPGKVMDVNPMKEAVFVAVQEGDTMRVIEFMKEDLQPLEELAALQKKATSPCDRHEGGGCDCGRARKPRSSH